MTTREERLKKELNKLTKKIKKKSLILRKNTGSSYAITKIQSLVTRIVWTIINALYGKKNSNTKTALS